MDERQKEITYLKGVVERLSRHLDKYITYQNEHQNGRLKKDREHALRSMISEAEYLKNKLTDPAVFPIIDDGKPYMLEEFPQFADSDTPSYIQKIEDYIKQNTTEV